MFGYGIIVCYGLLLIGIWRHGSRKKEIEQNTIKAAIFAGGKIPTWKLTASVFSSWLWVTSILGSAEAYYRYNIVGAVGYVIGACIAFGCFIPLMVTIFNRMPKAVTFLDYVGGRFSVETKMFYYIFAFSVSTYVLIEQAVGVASVMNSIFGISFKITAFFIVLIAAFFVAFSGMKGLLKFEVLASLIGVTMFAIWLTMLIRGQVYGENLFDLIYKTSDLSKNNQLTIKEILFSEAMLSGIRYFIAAIVIAFSQLLFDPAYYIKGKMAKDTRALIRAFSLGGILVWGVLGISSGVILGAISLSMKTNVIHVFNGAIILPFSIFIVIIGGSTIAHYLMGLFSIFSIDYYKENINPLANEAGMLKFGRTMVLSIGVFCALIAISLENISLLSIDMFCSIFFAAPCCPLLVGLLSKKRFNKWPILATTVGMLCGFLVWFLFRSQQEFGWFLATMVSFFVPLFLMILVKFSLRDEKQQA